MQPTRPLPSPELAEPTWSWPRERMTILAIAAIAIAVFANSLVNGHVYDDLRIIRDNPLVAGGIDLGAIFSGGYWGEGDAATRLYRPLAILSLAIDRHLFGPGPFPVHLGNVLANALIAVLLYALVLRLLARRDVALLSALVFAIHPVHTEVVANGVGRAELHALALMLGAAHFHVTWIERRRATQPSVRSRGTGRVVTEHRSPLPPLVGSLALSLCALLYKESAVVLPALLFLIDWLLVERGHVKPVLRRIMPYFAYAAPLAAYLVMRQSAIGSATPVVQDVMLGATAGARMLHAGATLLRYVGQLVLPLYLCAEHMDYTRLVRESATDPLAIASVVAAPVLAITIVWLAMRRHIVPLLAILWFLVAILPVSNLLIPIGTVRGDRLLFVPSIGFALALGFAVAELARRAPRTGAAVAAITLAFYAVRSIDRNADWRTQESLCLSTVRANPGSAPAWAMLGGVHRDAGRLDDAEEAYERALALLDGAGLSKPAVRFNYAQLLQDRGEAIAAITQYRQILADQPDHYETLVNYGFARAREEDGLADAIILFQRAATAQPGRPEALANLAVTLRAAGRASEALAAIDLALLLRPNHPELLEIRAECLIATGRAAEQG